VHDKQKQYIEKELFMKRSMFTVLLLAFAVLNAAAQNREVARDRDLVITLSDISSTAQFYPVEIEGTRMEVFAVLAPDGTVRTAFNTCQSCYASGRGFYVQEGDRLVCQNCQKRFRLSQVEVRAGGCNPVPIFAANKTVTAETITIRKEYLREQRGIFARWKRS
jgi:uncharacterized membrane protein